MEISALSNALSAQAAMGRLITDVLDQAAELVSQQAMSSAQQMITANTNATALEGLGENLDVIA